MTFKAIRVDKSDSGQQVRFVEMDESELMDGDVTIRVTHSTVNYKDGLALSGKSAIPRRFPMVLGVDLAGIVETSSHQGFVPGDEVIVNGWGLGETHYGGYAERARVKGDWLVKLEEGFTRAEAMAVGTARVTAVPVVVHKFPAKTKMTEAHLVKSQDSVALQPMTIEEAVKECEFRDRGVFVFRDKKGLVRVLHRRDDGKLELIEVP